MVFASFWVAALEVHADLLSDFRHNHPLWSLFFLLFLFLRFILLEFYFIPPFPELLFEFCLSSLVVFNDFAPLCIFVRFHRSLCRLQLHGTFGL